MESYEPAARTIKVDSSLDLPVIENEMKTSFGSPPVA
jgi:hypothetical protein